MNNRPPSIAPRRAASFSPILLWCLLIFLGLGKTAISQTALPFLHPLFSSNMVLQRDAADPVWGWTSAVGATVTVVVKDQNGATLQTATAVSGSDKKWQTNVGPFGLVANNAAYSLVISSPGATTQTLTNVLIGDVWLCSGQSNMEYALEGSSTGTAMVNRANEIADAAANYPNIRQFKATRGVVASVPQDVFIGGIDSGGWTTNSNAAKFTAVGFFMARTIYNKVQVPIGLLNITWGGTDIIPWVPGETLRTIADYAPIVDALPGNASPGNGTATAIYNSMMAPATSFQIKGAIWYQGESSVSYGLQKYSAVLGALKRGFRQKFRQPSLPFITMQLCTNDIPQTVPVEAVSNSNYAEIRGAELADYLSDAANTRMVVTIDAGFVSNATNYYADIHPINKQDPGKRAGEAALNLVYGQSTSYLPPIFNRAVVEGATLRCYFDNVPNGLMVGLKPQGTYTSSPPPPVQELPSGKLTGFAIAGADKVYYAATATIDSATKTVVVSSPNVATPVHVRYGWVTNPWNTTVPSASGSFGTPLCNLYGKVLNGGAVVDGSPASPFRSGGDAPAQLSVNAGTGSGATYTPGQVVSVTATNAAGGTSFASWSGDTDLLSNANAASTTATLSRPYVSIRANYRITNAPSGLSAVAENQKITLSWNAVTSANAHVSYYNVKRASSAGGPYSTIGRSYTSSYVDTPVTNNTPYYYVFSAVNAVSESPDSSQLAATPVPTISGLATTPGNAQITLNWTAYAGQVNSYSVKRGTATGGPFTTIATGLTNTTFSDSRVVAGTIYFYVISVVDNAGENPYSLSKAGALNSLPPPLSATDIGTISPASLANFTAETFSVTAAGSDIYGGADSFNFVAAPISGDATLIAKVGGPNGAGKAGLMMRQSLAANSAYVDAVINGSGKFEYRTTTGGGAGNAGNGTGSLTYPYWIKLVRVGNVFTGYVAPANSPTTWTQVGTPQTIVMTNPIYVGFATCGQSGVSRSFTFDNVTAPWVYQASTSPGALTAVAATNRITLGWNAAAGATGYNVKRSVAGGSYTTIATNLNAVTYTDTAAPAGLASSYKVSSLNAVGEGADSTAVSATLPPAAPTSFTAAPGNGRVELSWSAPEGAASYTVRRGTANGGPYPASVSGISGTRYTDANLTNGVTYYYTLAAANTAGESSATSQIIATPVLPPITAAELAGPPFTFTETGAAIRLSATTMNRTYQLQRSYTLDSGSWENIGAAQPGGASLNFSDSPDASKGKAFYRIQIGP